MNRITTLVSEHFSSLTLIIFSILSLLGRGLMRNFADQTKKDLESSRSNPRLSAFICGYL